MENNAYRRQLDEILPGYSNSRASHKQLNVQSYPVPATGGLLRVPSGVLTLQTGNRHKLGPSGSGTLGTTTIEYDEGLDDVEYLLKNSRVHSSYNPRNQLSQRLHKTIDENVVLNRLLSANK